MEDALLPKIPLDAAGDLQFLRQQLHNALSHRLALHLPSAGPDDPLRKRLDLLIQSFLSDTMRLACKNVLINGLDPRPSDLAKGVQSTPVEVFEPFDVALQLGVQEKYALVEREITEVTRLRREVPLAVADRYRAVHQLPPTETSGVKGVVREREVDESVELGQKRQLEAETAGEGGPGDPKRLNLGVQGTGQSSLPSPPAEEDDNQAPILPSSSSADTAVLRTGQEQGSHKDKDEEEEGLAVKIARLEEVVRTYEKSLAQLSKLGRGVGGVAAKVERARDVLQHIERSQLAKAKAAGAIAGA